MTSFLLHKLNSSTEQREEVLRRSQLFPFPETFLKKFNSLQHFFLSLSPALSVSRCNKCDGGDETKQSKNHINGFFVIHVDMLHKRSNKENCHFFSYSKDKENFPHGARFQ